MKIDFLLANSLIVCRLPVAYPPQNLNRHFLLVKNVKMHIYFISILQENVKIPKNCNRLPYFSKIILILFMRRSLFLAKKKINESINRSTSRDWSIKLPPV